MDKDNGFHIEKQQVRSKILTFEANKHPSSIKEIIKPTITSLQACGVDVIKLKTIALI